MSKKDLEIGLELGKGGHPVGRDPARMAQEELKALGHEPRPLLAVIRKYCLKCVGSPSEVRLCPSRKCELWPYRFGKNPFRSPVTEKQRAASQRNAKKLHRRAEKPVDGTDASDESGGSATPRSRRDETATE